MFDLIYEYKKNVHMNYDYLRPMQGCQKVLK